MHGARSSAGLLHPPGSGPNSFSCTWAHRRREPRCYFFTSPTLAPKLLAATLAPTSGRGRAVRPAQLRSARLGSARPGSAPFGPTRSRSAPRPTAAWSHSAPSWAKAAPPAPRPRNGSARAQRDTELRGGGWNSAAKVTRERSLRGAQSRSGMPWGLQCCLLSFGNANFVSWGGME